MKEEESDEEQIRGAEADYKAGRFARVRALVKEGKTVLIHLIRDEIMGVDKDISFLECESTLHFNYCDSSLNVYLEDGTFGLSIYFVYRQKSEKELRVVLAMVKIVKAYGFRDRET